MCSFVDSLIREASIRSKQSGEKGISATAIKKVREVRVCRCPHSKTPDKVITLTVQQTSLRKFKG